MDGLYGYAILPRIPADHPIRRGNRFDWLVHAVIVMLSTGDGACQTTPLNWKRIEAELIGMGVAKENVTREKVRQAVKRLENYGALETHVLEIATPKQPQRNSDTTPTQLQRNSKSFAKSVIIGNIFATRNSDATLMQPQDNPDATAKQPLVKEKGIIKKEEYSTILSPAPNGDGGLLANPGESKPGKKERKPRALSDFESKMAAVYNAKYPGVRWQDWVGAKWVFFQSKIKGADYSHDTLCAALAAFLEAPLWPEGEAHGFPQFVAKIGTLVAQVQQKVGSHASIVASDRDGPVPRGYYNPIHATAPPPVPVLRDGSAVN